MFSRETVGNEDSTSRIPLPQSRPNYNPNYFYFVTSPESPAPILDEVKGMTWLPGDTLIRFKILSNSIDGETNLVRFETVPTHVDDVVIRGQIPYNFIGEQLGERPTMENLVRFERAMKVYKEVEREKRMELEQSMTIEDVLKEFHETYCMNGGAAYTEVALKAKWDSYIKNGMLSPRGKQIAENAKALDFVSRTVLYETQRQSQLGERAHPKGAACQWDLIALSIRNRAFSNKVKRYGGSFRGDLVGVATDSQYNVWMKSKVKKNKNLLGCYLHSKYKKKKGGSAEVRANLYIGITEQIKETIGVVKDDQKVVDNDISHRFAITNFTRVPAPEIRDMTHYYHPGGMGRCNVDSRTSPTVRQGLLRDEGQASYGRAFLYPIINGKVLGHKNLQIIKGPRRHTNLIPGIDSQAFEWEIQVLQKEGGVWKRVSSEEAFRSRVTLVDTKDLDEKYTVNHYACLPLGVLPKCFEGKGIDPNKLSNRGIRVPYTWFNKDLRGEMETSLENMGFSYAKHNFTLPKKLSSANPAGVPIGLRCTSGNLRDEGRPKGQQYPEFGGDCDTNIVMASGVDQRMPILVNVPIPQPDPRRVRVNQ